MSLQGTPLSPSRSHPVATPSEMIAYENALELVMGLPDFERSTHNPGHSGFHLERMNLLLDRLDSPHLAVPTVHIAGTNGKGSTAAMVTSILRAGGYRVGLYTSPHLHRVTERIRIGMDPVGYCEFARLVRQVWAQAELVEQTGGYGPLTFFELMTAMAFLHFQQMGTDLQVIEVGLGGRLDSTNVVSPELSVITSVSLDHVVTLGNTVSLITVEKAGIIKEATPVVMAPQSLEAATVVRKIAAERHAPLKDVANDFTWQTLDTCTTGQSFHVAGAQGPYTLQTRLLGAHQVENAATAVAAVETLIDRGFTLSPDSVVKGIAETDWPGRLQVLSDTGPFILVDGAHNPDAARKLVAAVRRHFEYDRAILVFGFLGGHDALDVLGHLVDLSPVVVAVRSRHPRSAPTEVVVNSAVEMEIEVVGKYEIVAEGIQRAIEIANDRDIILGTGSLSVVAEVIEEIQKVDFETYPYLGRPRYRSTVV